MDQPTDGGQKGSLNDALAAERTFLAWIRTALALMGFGFVVARFGLFLQQMQLLQNLSSERHYGLSLWFGTVLIVVGVIVTIFATLHHVRLARQLARGEVVSIHPSREAVAIAIFLALVGVAMAIYLVSVRPSKDSHPANREQTSSLFVSPSAASGSKAKG